MLLAVVSMLVSAQPDQETIAKALAPVDTVNGSAHKSSSSNKKVRKEAPETPSKPPAATSVNGAIELLSTPGSTTKTGAKSKSPVPPASRSTPSRSTPTRSSKSRKAPSPVPSAPGTTPGRSTRVPAPVAEESDEEGEDVKPPLPDPVEDISEAQFLVQRLKALQEKATAPVTSAVKRTRDQADAPLVLNLDGPPKEVTYVPPSERAVATNRRILPRWPAMPRLDSNQKSAAWGTLAFAIGWGAATCVLYPAC